MFSRDTASRANSFSRVRKWVSDNASSGIPMIILLSLWLLFWLVVAEVNNLAKQT